LERGAFSDDSVVEASKKLMPVLVDCDWGKKNQDVAGKFGVRGYPTIIFTDSEGKEVERLHVRDAASVARQIDGVAEKYTKASVWAEYGDDVLRDAASGKKPVLLFFTDGKAKSAAQEDAFLEERLEKPLGQFLLVRHEISRECDFCNSIRMRKGPVIWFIDPLAEEPTKKPLYKVTSLKSTKQMLGVLKMVFKRWEKALKKHEE
jgi:thioredoxin-like negative regulator of GroEL